jgi:heptaprenyl diphosphate synthase
LLPTDLSFEDPDLAAAVTAGLAAVESGLRSAVKSDYPFVTETSNHLVRAGGKRLRPLLVLLAAQFADRNAPGVVPAAVVVELTHLATLYHDDVMDEAPLRRGVDSANSRWGNTVAILTGDFLFSRASDILADLGPEAVRIQARTFERLVTGQIRESVGPEPGRDPVEHYLRVLADKTGSLGGTCGRFGAMLSGADDATAKCLTRFGELFGVAFQLSDDLLDVASEAEASGKTPGTDLRAGVRTLPVLLALRSADPQRARLRELLNGDLSLDQAHAEALDALRRDVAMGEARSILDEWAGDARRALEPLADIPARAALAAMCDALVTRTG